MSKAHSFTITETTTGDMARAFMRFQFRQPLVIVTYALMLLLSVYIGYSFRNIWYGVAYAVMAFGLLPWSRYRNLQKRFKASFPVGSTITATLKSKELALELPQASSKISYDVFRDIIEQGEYLVLRQRVSKLCVVLPRALFPDEVLDELKAHITSPR